jgi:hypothetical protein
MALHPGEKITEGLRLGRARFAKWRAAITILGPWDASGQAGPDRDGHPDRAITWLVVFIMSGVLTNRSLTKDTLVVKHERASRTG